MTNAMALLIAQHELRTRRGRRKLEQVNNIIQRRRQLLEHYSTRICSLSGTVLSSYRRYLMTYELREAYQGLFNEHWQKHVRFMSKHDAFLAEAGLGA